MLRTWQTWAKRDLTLEHLRLCSGKFSPSAAEFSFVENLENENTSVSDPSAHSVAGFVVCSSGLQSEEIFCCFAALPFSALLVKKTGTVRDQRPEPSLFLLSLSQGEDLLGISFALVPLSTWK